MSLENELNKATKSESTFLAIASPNNLPISEATFLDAESLAKSVMVVMIPTSLAVIVVSVGFTAVLDKSVPSAIADAEIAGYTGTAICFPCPVIE